MKTTFFSFFMLVLPLVNHTAFLKAQSSYQLIMDSVGLIVNNVMVNENEEPLILVTPKISSLSKYLYLLPIGGQSGTSNGWKVDVNNNQQFGYIGESSYNNNDWACFSSNHGNSPKATFSSVNLYTGEGWSKFFYCSGLFSVNFIQDEQGNITVVNIPPPSISPYGIPGVVEIYKLNKHGQPIWKKGLLLLQSNSSATAGTIKDIAKDENGDIFILGALNNDKPFIMKLGPDGNPMVWKSLENVYYLGRMLVYDGGVALLDKGFLENWGYDLTPQSASLVKLDHDLNFIWAKKYHADNFQYSTASIAPLYNGNLMMSHSTVGTFPVILSTLDASGNILSQKGYPNYTPKMHVLKDGAFLITSQQRFDTLGNTVNQPIVAKTDTDGNIAGCQNYPTCLESEDIAVSFGNFMLDTFTILDLEPALINTEAVSFGFSDFCGFPPVPEPGFSFPDTLCLNNSASTSKTNNRLAQAREWHLTGPGTDSLLRDSFDFTYNFTKPGEYLLKQTVWVLGCSYISEQGVTVLPALEVAISPEHICPGSPQILEVVGNRNPTSYLWSNGSSSSDLEIQASGNYWVTASDGYCETTDDAYITVVSDTLNGQPPFTLPSDTTICDRDLPFLLIPHSGFNDVFSLENGPVQAAGFQLPSAGTFNVGMQAFGCNFEKSYHLMVNCRAEVYVPTSFSPNGDGINDIFRPYGKDFEVLELIIYDRWGGLRFQGKEWDGGKAGQGMYVYRLLYLNLLTQKNETIQGEVTLLK